MGRFPILYNVCGKEANHENYDEEQRLFQISQLQK